MSLAFAVLSIMLWRYLLICSVGWFMLETIGRIVSSCLCSFGMPYRVPALVLSRFFVRVLYSLSVISLVLFRFFSRCLIFCMVSFIIGFSSFL